MFEFIKNLSKVTDENFSEFFANAVKKVTDKKAYSAFQGEGEKAVTFNALIKEAEKYCKRNYEWFFKGNFTTDEEHLEVNFGGDKMPKDFKKITFDNGRVRLKGVIDRVDFYGDYARIIDYKTGKSDDSFKALFTGEKLQLYLYALALKDKKLAGAYYMPIIDEYSSEENKQGSLVIGNTLEDDEILSANDENFRDKNESEYLPVKMGKNKLLGTLKEEEMSSLTEYARQMGERAVEQMKDGIVVASPLDKACDYCAYHAVCGIREENVRKVKRVTDGTVTKAILGEEND